MKKQNAGKGICYLLTYALFVLLALWALPALLGWVGGLAARNYRLAPLIAANVLYWAVLAFLLLFRTHQSARLGRKGVFLSAALFLLSLCLTVFALWQDRGWEGMILLTVEQLYDSVLLLRARKRNPRSETNEERDKHSECL